LNYSEYSNNSNYSEAGNRTVAAILCASRRKKRAAVHSLKHTTALSYLLFMTLTVRGTVLTAAAAGAFAGTLVLDHPAHDRANDHKKHKAYQDGSEICL
jgi:hypothetical protein